MEAIGKIDHISETETSGQDNQYKTRKAIVDFSFEHQGIQMTNILELTFENEKVDLLNGLTVGERINASFAPQGRYYDKKVRDASGNETGETAKAHFQFNRCWAITKAS